MEKVLVDVNKCVGCGLCAKDCVAFDIKIVDGKAVANGKSCIECGHCEAICPSGAITLPGYDDVVEEMKQTRLNPEEYMNAIKTRRSIRSFTSEEVTDEVVEMILEAGRLTHTAANGQKTSYVLLKNKKKECEALAVNLFSKLLKTGKAVIPFLKNMEIDENFFFKGAPIVIIILGNDKVSGSLAAESMSLMAEANGLGVLFSGFFTSCFNMSSKIKKAIGLPGKTKAIITLVIGHPAVKYQRTVHRKPIKITRA